MGEKTYNDLANLLKNYNLSHNSNTDAVILYEYLECIQKLANALVDFLKNHQNYPNVFLDGAKQKNPKLKTNAQANGTYADFIAENGLETIFQKGFLLHIMKNTQHFHGFSISETHGTALAGKTLNVVNGTELGIQIQNGSFKVQVLESSSRSTGNFWKYWDQVFPKLQNCNKWQRNESKGRKERYFSYSQKVQGPKVQGPWYNKPLMDIVADWNTMYNKCLVVLRELGKYC